MAKGAEVLRGMLPKAAAQKQECTAARADVDCGGQQTLRPEAHTPPRYQKAVARGGEILGSLVPSRWQRRPHSSRKWVKSLLL